MAKSPALVHVKAIIMGTYAAAILFAASGVSSHLHAQNLVRCTAPDGRTSYQHTCEPGHKTTGMFGREIRPPEPAKKKAGDPNIEWHTEPRRTSKLIEPFKYKLPGHVTDAEGEVTASCYWRGKITGAGSYCGDSHADLTRVRQGSDYGGSDFFVCKDGTACNVKRVCGSSGPGSDHELVRMDFMGPHMKKTDAYWDVLRKFEQAVKACSAFLPTVGEAARQTYRP